MQVKQNKTHWAGRRGIAFGPARNGKQSIVELEPVKGESKFSIPVGIVVSTLDFWVLDEAAEVAAAEEEAAALQGSPRQADATAAAHSADSAAAAAATEDGEATPAGAATAPKRKRKAEGAGAEGERPLVVQLQR